MALGMRVRKSWVCGIAHPVFEIWWYYWLDIDLGHITKQHWATASKDRNEIYNDYFTRHSQVSPQKSMFTFILRNPRYSAIHPKSAMPLQRNCPSVWNLTSVAHLGWCHWTCRWCLRGLFGENKPWNIVYCMFLVTILVSFLVVGRC